MWHFQCFCSNWLSTFGEIIHIMNYKNFNELLKCIFQRKTTKFAGFLRWSISRYFWNHILILVFLSRKKKKNTDRSDVSVRHNTFRIVKNAFRKKIYIYITDVLYFRTIRITWKLRLYGVLIYFSIVNLVFHKTIILRSTCSVLLYI